MAEMTRMPPPIKQNCDRGILSWTLGSLGSLESILRSEGFQEERKKEVRGIPLGPSGRSLAGSFKYGEYEGSRCEENARGGRDFENTDEEFEGEIKGENTSSEAPALVENEDEEARTVVVETHESLEAQEG